MSAQEEVVSMAELRIQVEHQLRAELAAEMFPQMEAGEEDLRRRCAAREDQLITSHAVELAGMRRRLQEATRTGEDAKARASSLQQQLDAALQRCADLEDGRAAEATRLPVAEAITVLEQKKKQAIAREDFAEAKALKMQIAELQQGCGMEESHGAQLEQCRTTIRKLQQQLRRSEQSNAELHQELQWARQTSAVWVEDAQEEPDAEPEKSRKRGKKVACGDEGASETPRPKAKSRAKTARGGEEAPPAKRKRGRAQKENVAQ